MVAPAISAVDGLHLPKLSPRRRHVGKEGVRRKLSVGRHILELVASNKKTISSPLLTTSERSAHYQHSHHPPSTIRTKSFGFERCQDES